MLEQAARQIWFDWEFFYFKYFKIELDNVIYELDFPQLGNFFKPWHSIFSLVIPKGLTHDKVIAAYQGLFPYCTSWGDNLDKAVTNSERNPGCGSYIIQVRNRQEADKELQFLSANQLRQQGVRTMTLLERMVLELKYYDKTGKHLDQKAITLCAGSSFINEQVPICFWYNETFNIKWHLNDIKGAKLRAREILCFSLI